MALYSLLPCRLTAWLGLWALMDEAWSQLDDPLVLQILAMFRWVRGRGPGLAAPSAWCAPIKVRACCSAAAAASHLRRRYVPADMSGAGIPPRFSAEQVRRVPQASSRLLDEALLSLESDQIRFRI